MPSSYTTTDRVEKQAAGENNNSWGTRLNTGTTDMLVEAMNGVASYTLSGSKTLTTANGSTDEARCFMQNITGGTGGTVTIPNVAKHYLVKNATSGSVIFTTGSGTTYTVATGRTALVFSIGGNVVYGVDIQSAAEITTAARTVLDDTTVAAMRATLGLTQGWSFFAAGDLSGTKPVAAGVAPYSFTITEANCVVKAFTAATAQTTFTIKGGAAGSTTLGTAVFAIGGTTATVTITSASVTVGDLLNLVPPASADATLDHITGKIVE